LVPVCAQVCVARSRCVVVRELRGSASGAIGSVGEVKLDLYRSCSRAEKRQVLEVFWRRDVVASDRITSAALQYGPWAVLCCVVLALEPIPVLAFSVGHSHALLVAAGVVEVLVLVTLWWAAVRFTSLSRQMIR
jgi:hypothetical protein